MFRGKRDKDEDEGIEFEEVEVPPEIAKELVRSLAKLVRINQDGLFEKVEAEHKEHFGDNIRTYFSLLGESQQCGDPECPLHDGIIVSTHAAGPDSNARDTRTESMITIVMVDEHQRDPANVYYFTTQEVIKIISGLQSAVNEAMQRNRGLKT